MPNVITAWSQRLQTADERRTRKLPLEVETIEQRLFTVLRGPESCGPKDQPPLPFADCSNWPMLETVLSTLRPPALGALLLVDHAIIH